MTKTRFFIATALLALLGACETIEGAGQDISAAGDAVSDAAQDTQAGY